MKELDTYEKIALNSIAIDPTTTDEAYKLYRLSTGKPVLPQTTDFTLHQMSLRWARGEAQKKYVTDVKAMLRGGSTDTGDDRSKADLIHEMNRLASSTTDPKLRATLLMNVAQLVSARAKDDNATESHVSYYLPLRCNECPLYMQWEAYRQRHTEATTQQLTDSEWDAIMAMATEKGKEMAREGKNKAQG